MHEAAQESNDGRFANEFLSQPICHNSYGKACDSSIFYETAAAEKITFAR